MLARMKGISTQSAANMISLERGMISASSNQNQFGQIQSIKDALKGMGAFNNGKGINNNN